MRLAQSALPLPFFPTSGVRQLVEQLGRLFVPTFKGLIADKTVHLFGDLVFALGRLLFENTVGKIGRGLWSLAGSLRSPLGAWCI
jgi:hypothetical protein